jgi:hypothetical protein
VKSNFAMVFSTLKIARAGGATEIFALRVAASILRSDRLLDKSQYR